MKVHPIPHVICDTTWSGFIQTSHHCSVSWKITPLYCFSSNLIYFGQKWPIEVTFFSVSFSLNFASPFSVMTHNLSELFWQKHFMLWTKRAHHCTILQAFDCCNESWPDSSCYLFLKPKDKDLFKFCTTVQCHER